MSCGDIKRLLPLYIDHELGSNQSRLVKEHLASCLGCQVELQRLKQAWDALGEWKEIEPDPYFVSRFWTTLSQRQAEQKRTRSPFFALRRQLAPVLVAASIMVIVGSFVWRRQAVERNAMQLLVESPGVELEMIAHMDLIEDYEILEQIDELRDAAIIENLDLLESNKA